MNDAAPKTRSAALSKQDRDRGTAAAEPGTGHGERIEPDERDPVIAALLAAVSAVRNDSIDAGLDAAAVLLEHLCRSRSTPLKTLLGALEQRIILSVLRQAQGSQRTAAVLLGLKFTTLNSKLKKNGIRVERQVSLSVAVDGSPQARSGGSRTASPEPDGPEPDMSAPETGRAGGETRRAEASGWGWA